MTPTQTIVALGKPAISLAKSFSQYPEYKILTLGLDNPGFSEHILITGLGNPEQIEESVPDLTDFFSSVTGEVMFLVVGGSRLSPATLKVLYYLRELNKLTVVYIQPDLDFLSSQDRRMERVAFGVLQEYARSGVFQRLFLVSNSECSNLIESSTISSYYSKLNETISSGLHMLNVLEHSEPVLSTFAELAAASRIATIGFAGFDQPTQKFFPLHSTTEEKIFFGIPKSQIESDITLFPRIKSYLKNGEQTSQKTFAVFPTNYELPMILEVDYTNKIQQFNPEN